MPELPETPEPDVARGQVVPVTFIFNAASNRVLVDVNELAGYLAALARENDDSIVEAVHDWLLAQHSRVLREISSARRLL